MLWLQSALKFLEQFVLWVTVNGGGLLLVLTSLWLADKPSKETAGPCGIKKDR